MLVVRIERWPGRDASRRSDLAVVAIDNAGGNAESADFDFVVSHQAGLRDRVTLDPLELLRDPRLGWKSGKIKGYNTRYGAVRLVHWVLRRAFDQRKRGSR